jgi:hypothetical protein
MLCICCRLPTCIDCMDMRKEDMSWCEACIKDGGTEEYLKKYKPCCICDVVSTMHRRIEFLYPTHFINHNVSKQAYVYANMCETCTKKYTWLIPYTYCDMYFDISYSCTICININQLRDIMFIEIEEYIPLPKELSKIVIKYYVPVRNYACLYKFTLTSGRIHNILYNFPLKKLNSLS